MSKNNQKHEKKAPASQKEQEVKLDLKDRKLLYALDLNARQSYLELGRKTGVSKDVVIYRMKQLEKKGVIEGYYSLIDFGRLGYQMFRVYVKLQDTSSKEEKEMLDYVTAEKSSFWVARISGDWDFVFAFIVRTAKEFDSMWEEFQLRFKRYIFENNIAILYEYVHFRKDYLIGKPNPDFNPNITGSTEKADVDKTDIKILKIIATNARIPLVDIARKLKLTSTAISYRIKQLEKKKVILGYRVMISLAKTGYEYYKVDLVLEDVSIRKQLFQFARQHQNCVYVDRTVGGSDFEFDFELRNQREFLTVMDQLKDQFKGLIRNYKYYLATVIYKISYLPPI